LGKISAALAVVSSLPKAMSMRTVGLLMATTVSAVAQLDVARLVDSLGWRKCLPPVNIAAFLCVPYSRVFRYGNHATENLSWCSTACILLALSSAVTVAFTSLFSDIIHSFVVHFQCSVLNVGERLLPRTGRIMPFVAKIFSSIGSRMAVLPSLVSIMWFTKKKFYGSELIRAVYLFFTDHGV
jgi:hypothetical protein